MQRKSVSSSMEALDEITMETLNNKLNKIIEYLDEIRNAQVKNTQAPKNLEGAITTKVAAAPSKLAQSRPNFLKTRFSDVDITDYDIATGKIPPKDDDPLSYPSTLPIMSESEIEAKEPKVKNAKDAMSKRKAIADYMWKNFTKDQKEILGKFQTLCASQPEAQKDDVIDSDSEP